MASIYLTCTANTIGHPYAKRDYERLTYYASKDTIHRHIIVDDPKEADVIAFIGSSQPNFSDIKRSSLFRRYRHKAVIFYSGDRAIPILPGIYTCLEKRWFIPFRKSLLSGFYLRVTDNNYLDNIQDAKHTRYLYSFVGSTKNHPVRNQILMLRDSRAFLKDSSADHNAQADGITGKNKERGNFYKDVVAESKFVLCPRGIGVSSWRLFETMRAGRVPVIISNDWTQPPGPKWNSFSLFVRENEIRQIPSLLRDAEPRAMEMGHLARAAWDLYYSEGRVFNTLADQLLAVREGIDSEKRLSRLLTYTQYLEPHYFRYWLLSPVKHSITKLSATVDRRHH